ncbi:MAG: T9SS type A sorting domain-containing protein [Bacteroidales bacterium]|nr:T9SS type A sorting domain-containing protein [Bacteroidales bacterium]
MKNFYRLALLAMFAALFNFATAQTRDYIPMINENAQWLETYYHTPNPYGYNQAAKLFFDGDTSINSIQYVKIFKGFVDVFCQTTFVSGPDYAGALREDNAGQKVWIVEPGEIQESLYFDFTFEVGDTIPEDSHFIDEYFSPVVVYEIDTLTGIDGINRRQWTFQFEEFTYGSRMIEGIGNINGLLTSYFLQFEYFENLYCFSIDTSLIYSFSGPNSCTLLSDTCVTVGIDEPDFHEIKNQFLSVYPIPAKNFICLQFTNGIPEGETILHILDFTGKVVYSTMIQENQSPAETINVNTWQAGIYIAIIRDNGLIKGKCKFVIQQ